jgi:protein-tyrosine phosphatase
LAPHRCLEADSAGTHGYHAGQPPDARAQLVARGHGLDISGLRARQLGREDFDQFDWILVMDQRNYSDVLLVAPAGAQERVRLLLDFVPDLKSKEVPDPYYGRVSDFELAYDLIDRAVCSLLTTF